MRTLTLFADVIWRAFTRLDLYLLGVISSQVQEKRTGSSLNFPVQGTSSLGSSVSALWKGKQSRTTCFLGQCWSSPSELSPALDASLKGRAASQLHLNFPAVRWTNAAALWTQTQALQCRLGPRIHTLLSHQPWTLGQKCHASTALSSETHQAPQLGAQPWEEAWQVTRNRTPPALLRWVEERRESIQLLLRPKERSHWLGRPIPLGLHRPLTGCGGRGGEGRPGQRLAAAAAGGGAPPGGLPWGRAVSR